MSVTIFSAPRPGITLDVEVAMAEAEAAALAEQDADTELDECVEHETLIDKEVAYYGQDQITSLV